MRIKGPSMIQNNPSQRKTFEAPPRALPLLPSSGEALAAPAPVGTRAPASSFWGRSVGRQSRVASPIGLPMERLS